MLKLISTVNLFRVDMRIEITEDFAAFSMQRINDGAAQLIMRLAFVV